MINIAKYQEQIQLKPGVMHLNLDITIIEKQVLSIIVILRPRLIGFILEIAKVLREKSFKKSIL
jgi:hypothetical protein